MKRFCSPKFLEKYSVVALSNFCWTHIYSFCSECHVNTKKSFEMYLEITSKKLNLCFPLTGRLYGCLDHIFYPSSLTIFMYGGLWELLCMFLRRAAAPNCCSIRFHGFLEEEHVKTPDSGSIKKPSCCCCFMNF